MIVANSLIFILLVMGMYWILLWLKEVGVEEIVVYTQGFLKAEAKKLRIQVLPEVTSRKLWDRLELLLYYSGVRSSLPFLSGKVFLLCLMVIVSLGFLVGVVCFRRMFWGIALGLGFLLLILSLLQVARRVHHKQTEKHLLELLNLAESFSATGDEVLAILRAVSPYMKGPIGQALKNIERYVSKGWSSGMVLAQLKVSLEHPKWQEFIHNLSVCSMYHGEFSYVFRSSRKGIQTYLSSRKEQQSVKYTARMEMLAIVVLCLVIIVVLGNFLGISVEELLWGTVVGKGCTLYMAGIVMLFFWKMGNSERE